MRSLANLEARIERFEKRARLLNVPALVLIDVTSWDDEARAAYAAGTEEERIALETQHAGPLPNYTGDDDLAVLAIIVCELPTVAVADVDEGNEPFSTGTDAAAGNRR